MYMEKPSFTYVLHEGGMILKPLTVQQKKDIQYNLLLAGILMAIYLITYLIHRETMLFFWFFETGGTLLAVTLFLHRIKPMYFYGLCLFAMFAQYGGVMFQLYVKIPYYDIGLHFCSGILLVFAGHYLFSILTRRFSGVDLPQTVTLWFCGLFSVASAAVWEIWEFCADRFLGQNSQLGSLDDTMTDIIAGSTGAILGLLLLAIVLRRRKK